ncbi:IclR family transcriptional regulator domain-containing protein [Paraburkholderia graminis]|uniref:IclR family transcriptional regulator domain-containing protein n=1 Tax=Paraburkholderia graminis TaxID=60548 RepID=UPI0038BCF56D
MSQREKTKAEITTFVSELDQFAGDPDFMMSLARGLIVIRAFDEEHGRLTVAQVSERTGLPRSAARRCLYTLQQLGYVGAEGTNFCLKPRIVSLGHAYLASAPLAATAQPVLDRLARDLGETTTLAVLDQQDILFVAHSSRVPLVSVNIAVGSRLPAYCAANGQVLLAALPEGELEAYMSRAKFPRLTETTITSRKQLLERLKIVRRDGYAIADREFNLSMRSIAVPVRHGGRIAASMSFAVPAERVSIDDLRERLLPCLLAAASGFA